MGSNVHLTSEQNTTSSIRMFVDTTMSAYQCIYVFYLEKKTEVHMQWRNFHDDILRFTNQPTTNTWWDDEMKYNIRILLKSLNGQLIFNI